MPSVEIAIVDKLEIPGDHVAGSFSCRRNFAAEHVSLPLEHRVVNSGVMFVVIGDVAAIVGAVGHVAIDKQIRLPFIPETKPRTRLRRVGFHVVAIEVLIRAGRAPAHLGWTILIDAIVRTRSFVTVGVVNRNEEQDDVVQYSCRRFS